MPSKKEIRPESIRVQVIGSEVTIDDHSQNDDYQLVLALLETMGIKPEVKTESPCG